MHTQSDYVKQFVKDHPIQQSFHSGLYGFERVMDCINLNKCTYRSKKAAERARRTMAIEQYQLAMAIEQYQVAQSHSHGA